MYLFVYLVSHITFNGKIVYRVQFSAQTKNTHVYYYHHHHLHHHLMIWYTSSNIIQKIIRNYYLPTSAAFFVRERIRKPILPYKIIITAIGIAKNMHVDTSHKYPGFWSKAQNADSYNVELSVKYNEKYIYKKNTWERRENVVKLNM